MAKLTLIRDPIGYATQLVPVRPQHKRVLGLDLGTNCGTAFLDFVPHQPLVGLDVILDVWDLSIGTYDSGALRIVRLKQFLDILKPDMIGFEDVKYTPPQELIAARNLGLAGIIARTATAAEFLGILKGTICTWAEERGVPCQGFGIGTIKKRATGKGNSGKEAMVASLNKDFGTVFDPAKYEEERTDNIADAAYALVLVLENCAAGL